MSEKTNLQYKGKPILRPWFAVIQTIILFGMVIAFAIYGIVSLVELISYRKGVIDYGTYSTSMYYVFGILFGLWVLMIFLDFIFGNSVNKIGMYITGDPESGDYPMGFNVKDYYYKTFSKFYVLSLIYGFLSLYVTIFAARLAIFDGHHLVDFLNNTGAYAKAQLFFAVVTLTFPFSLLVLFYMIGQIAGITFCHETKQT
jgi:hypothetical protein